MMIRKGEMERFVEFMRRNENDKELRSTKILKFGWMISLSSTSNICNLSKFNNFNNLSSVYRCIYCGNSQWKN